MPIGVDEGIHSFADITTSAKAGAGGVSLKLIKLGGIIAAIEAGKLCQRLGLSVNIAAKIAESSISSAAALHLACAVPKADWGVSLTHFYLAEDIVRRPLPLAAVWSPCLTVPASASRSTKPRWSVSGSADLL